MKYNNYALPLMPLLAITALHYTMHLATPLHTGKTRHFRMLPRMIRIKPLGG